MIIGLIEEIWVEVVIIGPFFLMDYDLRNSEADGSHRMLTMKDGAYAPIGPEDVLEL